MFRPLNEDDRDRLRDESLFQGRADCLACPTDEAELSEALRQAARFGWPVTVQGARTGVAAGAVPESGALIDLSGMDRLLDARLTPNGAQVCVQPGLRLVDLRRLLADPPADGSPLGRLGAPGAWRFAPDPTESSASLGGMAATNASGALSFSQGPMRAHVDALRVVLADGDILVLRRGEHKVRDGRFTLRTEGGREISGAAPRYRSPEVKNAAGYYSRPDMDLLDAFVGSEGTLGVFSALTLRLQPAPAHSWGIMCFLPSEQAALALSDTLRDSVTTRPAALEYFDADALRLLWRAREDGQDLPPLEAHWATALYVEYEGERESDVAAGAEYLIEALNTAGGRDEDAWMATTAREMETLKLFRHALPETVNRLIEQRRREHPGLMKLGTDLAVPTPRFRALLERYRRDLGAEGFESVIFGHIGDNHLHVNILPRSPAEYARGREIYQAWAETVTTWGGSVAAEHGIGKLKKPLLAIMASPAQLDEMRRFKAWFDPAGRINPGNLFDRKKRLKKELTPNS